MTSKVKSGSMVVVVAVLVVVVDVFEFVFGTNCSVSMNNHLFTVLIRLQQH